jgi:ATP-dependent helicase/nuclease subunit B
MRLDRVDRVTGGVAVLDYKTGFAPAFPSLVEPRPRTPQLGLYAIAQRRGAAPELPVRAVAYGQLRPGEVRVRGIAANGEGWPALGRVPSQFAGDWHRFEAWWRDELGRLASEIRGGAARVDPRDGDKTCKYCALPALCRIRATALAREDGSDE